MRDKTELACWIRLPPLAAFEDAVVQALLASSHLLHEVKKNAVDHGVIVDGVRIDIGKMMAQKDKAVSGLTKGVEGLFKKYKVRVGWSLIHACSPWHG